MPKFTYYCLPEAMEPFPTKARPTPPANLPSTPTPGPLCRIVINADLDEERYPDVPLIRSQIMVEYGPVELGGKTYICPQRSVEVSRGRSESELNEWGMVFSLHSGFETMIGDVTFGGYHKLGVGSPRSAWIQETDRQKTSTPPKKPH